MVKRIQERPGVALGVIIALLLLCLLLLVGGLALFVLNDDEASDSNNDTENTQQESTDSSEGTTTTTTSTTGSSDSNGSDGSQGTDNSGTTDGNQGGNQTVGLIDLIAEFDTDPASASAKYQNGTVTVTGYVDEVTDASVIVNPTDGLYVGTSLECNVNSTGLLSSLTDGQQVTLTGEVGGLNLDVITFNDCVVQ